MDFGWSLWNNQVMGGGLAAAIAVGCDCVGDLVVSRCQLGVWINCGPRGIRCLWTKSAESPPGDTRAHGYATSLCDLSYWPPDLAKNPEAARMDAAQSSLPLRAINSLNVNKRPACLRLFASRIFIVWVVARATPLPPQRGCRRCRPSTIANGCERL